MSKTSASTTAKAVAGKAAKTAAAKKTAATKKAAAAKKTAKKKKPAAAPVFIRHYCQGLGDCHLLRFAKDDGSPWYLLIDCGLHSSVKDGSATMDAVVRNIATVTRVIDVLVITHEHWDHVSGFTTAAEHFAALTIGEVWMAWTENPADPQARAFDEFKGQAVAALQGVSQRLQGLSAADAGLRSLDSGLQALLGFQFGAKGERVRAARDAGAALATQGLRYLEPGRAPLAVDGLGNLRIYVLGPPRDTAFFRIRERASEMYEVGGGDALATALLSAVDTDSACGVVDYLAPFDPALGLSLSEALATNELPDNGEAAVRALVRDRYAAPAARPGRGQSDPAWRRIDGDWLGISADLAMQLDDRTNNSSLVLAFEFVDSGRILLFAADAQVGNWLSWQDLQWDVDGKAVSGPELLGRVVYYKVGHHGSQNATLKAKGLQLMDNPDLSAFIPTNERDAQKVKWETMPHPGIMEDLQRRAQLRVIRADDPWLSEAAETAPFREASGSLLSVTPGDAGLWVDVQVR